MVDLPPTIEIIGGILVDFDNNPTLKFSIGAQFSAAGDIMIFGTMKGERVLIGVTHPPGACVELVCKLIVLE